MREPIVLTVDDVAIGVPPAGRADHPRIPRIARTDGSFAEFAQFAARPSAGGAA